MTLGTPLPHDMDGFWASITNKTKLQLLLRTWILDNSEKFNSEIVLSGMYDPDRNYTKCIMKKQGVVQEMPELDSMLEEADLRLMPHAMNAAKTGHNLVVLLSNDTDVFVSGLFYWKILHMHGLSELWFKAGNDKTTRYIPLHRIAESIGNLCDVLPALHILTGSDCTSKFGTKPAALKAKPQEYLLDFGKETLNEQQIINAEEYLVHAIKKNSACKTMDELRHSLYDLTHTVEGLPPTSHLTRGHILRSFYNTHQIIHCLDNITELDPLQYEYEIQDGLLVPSVNLRILPEGFIGACNCGKCATARCPCRSNGAVCCRYCICKADSSTCKNPFRSKDN